MSELIFNAGLVLIGLAAGGGLGWYVRSLRCCKEGQASLQQSSKELIDAFESVQEREQKTDDVLRRVRELAENLAFDVEEHTEKVNKQSDRLKREKATQPNVLSAISAILKANETLQVRLQKAECKLDEQAQLIATHAKESRTDALTHVANRRAFDAEISEARTMLMKQQAPVTVMMIDVDHFKRLNDDFGHLAGDEVLRQVAKSLRRTTKQDGQVFRYGGEEFAVLFRDKKIGDVLEFAERVRASVGALGYEHEGLVLEATASAGLAELQPSELCDDAIRRADQALYAAKTNGRNRSYWNDGNKNHPIQVAASSDQNDDACEVEGGSLVKADSRTGWRAQISTSQEFLQDVQRRIAAQKRSGGTDSMILLRIDDIGQILHSRGEETAELLLRATAQFLKASVRDMDHVALVDDHVFGVWLPTAALVNAARIGERLRSAVSRCKVPAKGGALMFTVSVGVTPLEEGDTHETIIERCEKAINYASQRGGNRCYAAQGNSFAAVDANADLAFD